MNNTPMVQYIYITRPQTPLAMGELQNSASHPEYVLFGNSSTMAIGGLDSEWITVPMF